MVTRRRGRAAPGGFRFTPALRACLQGCRPPSDRHQRCTPALTQQTSMMRGGQAARAARLACTHLEVPRSPALSASDAQIRAAPAPSALHEGPGGAKATCSHRSGSERIYVFGVTLLTSFTVYRDRAYSHTPPAHPARTPPNPPAPPDMSPPAASEPPRRPHRSIGDFGDADAHCRRRRGRVSHGTVRGAN